MAVRLKYCRKLVCLQGLIKDDISWTHKKSGDAIEIYSISQCLQFTKHPARLDVPSWLQKKKNED